MYSRHCVYIACTLRVHCVDIVYTLCIHLHMYRMIGGICTIAGDFKRDGTMGVPIAEIL